MQSSDKNETQNENTNNETKPKKKSEFYDIEYIQSAIQSTTKDIEKGKITLRILQERLVKKQGEYNALQGKPVTKNREEKSKEIKEKREKVKNHKIFDPEYGKKKKNLKPGEEAKIIQKNTSLSEIQLENITDSVNKQVLYNSDLARQIEEVRKDKTRIKTKLEKIEEDNKELEEDLKEITEKNKNSMEKIKYAELAKTKEEGSDLNNKFYVKRDALENKYRKVIEANIKREKERKNDLSKQRLMFAVFADKARNKSNNNKTATTDMIKIDDSDELHDRTPILITLIDKWKYVIKYKKNMIDKYMKCADEIRVAFDKLLEFTGVDKYSDLPEIYEKNQEQMSSVDEYLSKISNEVELLNEKKKILQNQIDILTNKNKMETEDKIKLIEDKKNKIANLKNLNEEIVNNIKRKKNIFNKLEPRTFEFLKKLQNTYLYDFVIQKNYIDKQSKLTENNCISFLGTVYCYCQLIKDFEISVKQNNKNYNSTTLDNSDFVNKNIDNLKKDIRLKLSKMNYDNCINKERTYESIKNDLKKNTEFDKTIMRLANIIADKVNNMNNGYVDYSSMNMSDLNTNNASSNIFNETRKENISNKK